MTAAIRVDFNGVIIDDEPQHRDTDVVWRDFVGCAPADLSWPHA